jgi:hypothetical protein
LAKLERRPFPVSVRDLVSVESREFNNRITAGDVECSFQVTLYNSGRWFVTADFTDHGDILGDFFVLEFPVDGQNRGIQLGNDSPALGAGDTRRMTDNGLDPWIRDHWGEIRDAQLTARLSASPDVAALITTIILVVTVIGIVAFFAGPGKVEAGPCPDQGTFDHGQCVQFRKVPASGTDSPPLTR